MNSIDLLVQLERVAKLIDEKKREIRANLPDGYYTKGDLFEGATVSTVQVKKVNTNKCFSYMLRKGKMKAFLASCTVYINGLQRNGIDMETIEKFREGNGSYKKVVIR
jgi:hypothetical protein